MAREFGKLKNIIYIYSTKISKGLVHFNLPHRQAFSVIGNFMKQFHFIITFFLILSCSRLDPQKELLKGIRLYHADSLNEASSGASLPQDDSCLLNQSVSDRHRKAEVDK